MIRTGLGVLAVLLFAGTASAQFDSGAIITLLNSPTGIKQSASTSESGEYTFPAVRIGEYRVSAERAGFTQAVVEAV